MFEAIIEKIRYIQDIPIELTEKAIEAKAICAGAVVGLLIHPVGKDENLTMLELSIKSDDQAQIICAGSKIPIGQEGSRYVLDENWGDYKLCLFEELKDKNPIAFGEKPKRPNPKAV